MITKVSHLKYVYWVSVSTQKKSLNSTIETLYFTLMKIPLFQAKSKMAAIRCRLNGTKTKSIQVHTKCVCPFVWGYLGAVKVKVNFGPKMKKIVAISTYKDTN